MLSYACLCMAAVVIEVISEHILGQFLRLSRTENGLASKVKLMIHAYVGFIL